MTRFFVGLILGFIIGAVGLDGVSALLSSGTKAASTSLKETSKAAKTYNADHE